MSKETTANSVFSSLITASHILHNNNVVDAYGHVSVRNPTNPSTFFMSCSLAPALVSSLADLVEYRIDDAVAVQSDPPKGFAERCIHSEIYKAYPQVNSVVHAHSEAVLPFAIVNGPKLRPVFHMGGVMGSQVPIFDIAAHYHSSDRQDLLVTNTRLGSALAKQMTPSQAFLTGVSSTIKNLMGSSSLPPSFPPSPTILMKNHGFTCCGHSIEEAVYRAIYTQTNARVQTASLLLQATENVGKNRLDPNSATTIKDINYLSPEQCQGSWEANQGHAERPWKLWVREVSVNALYRNDLGPPPGA